MIFLSNECSTMRDIPVFPVELYVSYAGRVMNPNMHYNLFPIQHSVRTYTHNLKIQVIYSKGVLHIEQLLYYWRCAFCV